MPQGQERQLAPTRQDEAAAHPPKLDLEGVSGLQRVLDVDSSRATAHLRVTERLAPNTDLLVILTDYDRSSELHGEENARFLPALESKNPGITGFLDIGDNDFAALRATTDASGNLSFGIPESIGKFRLFVVQKTANGYDLVNVAQTDAERRT
jgi:hypothetical protein